MELTKRQLSRAKQYMLAHKEECRDPLTNEINHTMLAEKTAQVFDLYNPSPEMEIPEELFEIALDYN